MKFSGPEIALRDMRERNLRRKHVKGVEVCYDPLAESRAKFVRKYKANSSPWPDGIGAWYRPEDWVDGDDERGDRLIAVGEARARALDPWANMRANGGPCPPLAVIVDAVSIEPVSDPSVSSTKEETVSSDAKADRKAYMRELMRRKRAKAKQSGS